MANKKPNHKLRSKVYKSSGYGLIGLTTFGAFFAYQTAIDWSNFRQELDDFIIVQQETVKLNLAIAFPMLIAILVFLFVFRRKNREALKDKASMTLLTLIILLYLVYSVIEVAMVSLIGAFGGTFIDEFILNPLSLKHKALAERDQDIDQEYEREKRRLIARKEAEADLDGSV